VTLNLLIAVAAVLVFGAVALFVVGFVTSRRVDPVATRLQSLGGQEAEDSPAAIANDGNCRIDACDRACNFIGDRSQLPTSRRGRAPISGQVGAV